ncbi:sequence-specific DNA binding transcription factors [Striga asiatica]|uniref:Sequence-specific DNA binding transcription factors n=1 Tax=Striga asiatica TaxID=4170 RepID=A0A5A7Q1L6_STRAF|nr:sequence-specific DNA binding transcription factors [Striga asiatica]
MQDNNNSSYVDFNPQAPIRVHHHQHQNFPTIHENFPLTNGANQETLRANSASDEDEPSFNEDPKGKKSTSPWQRVKWTDAKVRLLITAVSYINEEMAHENGPKKKLANLHKKGKWKSVSKVMAERGHLVSPQQCEDKFNDLNKRYKRLNEILGRGTSCEVVENPALLDLMDHLSDKAKDEVRKILSSKHLHYEEMCSYHNGNRLHLPPDPNLQHSLRLALTSRDGHFNEENDEIDDQEGEFNECEENLGKRVKLCPSHEEFSFKNSLGPHENVISQTSKASNWNKLQLEEERLHIEAQMLELEKQKFKWQRFCRKKDRELEVMRMEIERMKLENERMALELRRKEMGLVE